MSFFHFLKKILAFNFCRFCVVIWFFHPCHTVNDLQLRRIFYLRFYPLHVFFYLNSWERASISLINVQCLTRALLVPFLYCLWYGAVLDCWLNLGPPALEASTLPLGYRGGGFDKSNSQIAKHKYRTHT